MKGKAPKGEGAAARVASPPTAASTTTPSTKAPSPSSRSSQQKQPAAKKKARFGKGAAPNPLSFAITTIAVIGVAYFCATHSLSTLVPFMKETFGSRKENNKDAGISGGGSKANNAPHEYSDDGYFGATTNPSEFTQIVPRACLASNVIIQNMSALGASCPGLKPKSERVDVEDIFTHCVPPARRCSRAIIDFQMQIGETADDKSHLFAEPNTIPEATPQEVHQMAQKTLSSQHQQQGVHSPHRHYYNPSDIRDRIVTLMEHVLDTVGRGGGAGPVSLVELNRGVYSVGENFASLPMAIVNALKRDKSTPLPVTVENLAFMWSVFKSVERHVSEFLFCETYPCSSPTEKKAAQELGANTLHLASPSFFSKIVAGKPPKSDNDEYWHLHIDRLQYGSFAVTSLLYLDGISEAGSKLYSNGGDVLPSSGEEEECVHGKDFSGGGFVFEGDVKAVIHPSIGRLSMFTSSSENPHYVDRVRCGVRRALTIAFTCDAEAGLRLGGTYTESPLFKVVQEALQYDPETQDVEFG